MAVDQTSRRLAKDSLALARALDRNEVIDRLAVNISRVGGRLPTLMAAADLPTLTLTLGASAYASGATTVSPVTTPKLFTFLRGPWAAGVGFPKSSYVINRAVTSSPGNAVVSTAPLVRFWHSAPDLEIVTLSSERGYRLKVDGQYVATGAVANGLGDGNVYYHRVKWGDGSASDRRARLYELEFVENGLFGGVRAPNTDAPWPAPVPDRLRGVVYGDSFVGGSNSTYGALQPPMSAQIAALLGQPDTIGSGVGSTGYLAAPGGLNSLAARAATDIIARSPAFVIDLGGINDRDLTAANPAAFDAAYRAFLAQVIGALPEVLIFATGPMAPKALFNTEQWNVYIRDAKKAACALYPANCIFIDNLGEGWVTGTGKVGATTGDGNGDWVTSADGTHPTDDGASYLARRIVSAVALRLEAARA